LRNRPTNPKRSEAVRRAGGTASLRLGFVPRADLCTAARTPLHSARPRAIIPAVRTAAIGGTFADPAKGSTFVVGGCAATVRYFGGAGNDVVLSGFTPIPEPPAVAGLLLVAAAATVIRLRRR
jgi:hypothetical protein